MKFRWKMLSHDKDIIKIIALLTGCREGEAQCGNSTQCIGEELFCNGENDCANFHDEKFEICGTIKLI